MEFLRKQLEESSKYVALDADEKALMRERLVSYMEYKPLPKKQSALGEQTRFVRFGSFFRAHHLAGALMIALVVTTSSVSVSSAAAEALPGDLLYPVKVHINEGVKTVFMSSDEARVAWNRERAEKRLEEAGVLASQGRLDGAAQKEVARQFAKHTEAVVEQVRALEETDPAYAAEASSEFEEALGTHEAVLARLIVEQDDSEVGDGARELVEQVHAAAEAAGEMREAAEVKLAFAPETVEKDGEEGHSTSDDASLETVVVVTPDEVEEVKGVSKSESANMHVRAAYRAQNRALEQLTRAQTLLASIDDDSELYGPARAQIATGNTLMAEGETALAEHELGQAYAAYRNAAVKFQNVAELLEVADLFEVEIYPPKKSVAVSSEVSEGAELEETEEVAEDRGGFLSGMLMPRKETVEASVEVRLRSEEAIREARGLLLQMDDHDAQTLARANALIKDAAAENLRGEIYMVLEEDVDAAELFMSADEHARRAIALLQKSVGVQSDAAPQTPLDDVSVPDEPTQGEGSEDAAEEVLDVYHSFTEGVHTYTGALGVASSCAQVSASLSVAESYPEQITLALETIVSETDECVATTTLPFTATTTASAEATLVNVTLNAETVGWVLVGDGAVEEVDASAN